MKQFFLQLISDDNGNISSMRIAFLLVVVVVVFDVLVRGMNEWHSASLGVANGGKAAQRWKE